MDTIRHINFRWIWIFSGLFALMLMGLLLLPPAFSTQAASAKGAKGRGTVTCTVSPVKGVKRPKIICTGGQGTIFCTGGPVTSEKVGKEERITVVGKEQQTTVKGTQGQGAPITCTVGKK
jgi:hypothetical protein